MKFIKRLFGRFSRRMADMYLDDSNEIEGGE